MKPDKYYIDASSFLEVTGELADFMMQEKLGEKYYEDCIYVDEDDVYNFTDKGQEIFNNYVDQMTRILSEANIVHEDQLQEGEWKWLKYRLEKYIAIKEILFLLAQRKMLKIGKLKKRNGKSKIFL